MQIKVFKASSMREAVAQMKQELGENAVILHTKKYKDGGFLGMGSREMIELTAAIEDEKPAKKELPTEKIEPPSEPSETPLAVRPPSVLSQYKTSGTAEGVALAERTQKVRAAMEGLRSETPLSSEETTATAAEKTFEASLEEAQSTVDNQTVDDQTVDDQTVEEPPVETEGMVEEPSTETPSERTATSELLTAAMNIASTSEAAQERVEAPAAPLPTEISNLTAEPNVAPAASKSEQLTEAPASQNVNQSVNPNQNPSTAMPTVTLTTDQLAQMQAAMVAQAVAQIQLNTLPPSQPAPTSEPPKSEAVTAAPPVEREVKREAVVAERSEADRASEEKIKKLESEIAAMKAMLAKVLGRDVTRGTVSLHEALRLQEVSEDILNDMAVTAGAGETLVDSLSAEARATLINYLRANVIFSEGIKLNRHGVRIAALLGTTGVGKTTTLAKIAAKFVLENQVTAALITADTYRISAVEQLRTYSDILGLPLEIVYTPAELSKAIVKHRTRDLILIDTAGRSQHNDYQMKELVDLLSINQRIEKHLVLSVTTKQSDAQDIIDKFSVCDPDKVIFTKTDETSTLGLILNLLVKQPRLGLSYLTNGQSVPDDIIAGTADNLVDLLFRAE